MVLIYSAFTLQKRCNMLEQLQAEIRAEADPAKAMFFPKFFKSGPGEYAEGDKFLGVTVPKQRAVAKKYYSDITLNETHILLKSPWHEERLTALFILVLKFQKGSEATKNEIFDLYVENTDYINNWDLVDSSADKIVGAWLNDNPYKMKVLNKLAVSGDLWERRIAMIATFNYIKQGRGEEALEIAEVLVDDSHDLINKAVGWMLREVGKKVGSELLLDFLDRHAASMPRTALRYAIEHLDSKTRQHYLGLKESA